MFALSFAIVPNRFWLLLLLLQFLSKEFFLPFQEEQNIIIASQVPRDCNSLHLGTLQILSPLWETCTWFMHRSKWISFVRGLNHKFLPIDMRVEIQNKHRFDVLRFVYCWDSSQFIKTLCCLYEWTLVLTHLICGTYQRVICKSKGSSIQNFPMFSCRVKKWALGAKMEIFDS